MAALRKMADRFRKAESLTGSFTQRRRTALLDEPMTSSGMLYYRRAPETLVFALEKPRRTEVHIDITSYQVWRPDERQLERFVFEDRDVLRGIFTAFNPELERIGALFKVELAEQKQGCSRVSITPLEVKVQRFFSRLWLTLQDSDGALRGLSLREAEGDDVEFELGELALNASVPPALFDLKIPEGTRVLEHRVKKDE